MNKLQESAVIHSKKIKCDIAILPKQSEISRHLQNDGQDLTSANPLSLTRLNIEQIAIELINHANHLRDQIKIKCQQINEEG